MFTNLVCWLVAGLVAGKFVDQRDDDPKLAPGPGAIGTSACGSARGSTCSMWAAFGTPWPAGRSCSPGGTYPAA